MIRIKSPKILPSVVKLLRSDFIITPLCGWSAFLFLRKECAWNRFLIQFLWDDCGNKTTRKAFARMPYFILPSDLSKYGGSQF